MISSVQPSMRASTGPVRPDTAGCPNCLHNDVFGKYVTDLVTLSKFLPAGELYREAGATAAKMQAAEPPLDNVPDVRLSRPLVIVPGWTTKPSKFDALVGRLTDKGLNGGRAYYVKEGTVYQDKACSQPAKAVGKDAKVFVMVFDNPLQPPDKTGPQLTRDFAAVQQATGASKLDAMGYSLGTIATRVYLDGKGHDALGKVMLLGAPNHGTGFAGLACRVICRNIRWAMGLGGLSVADLPAMAWMGALGPNGKDNPQLANLNRHWDRQKANTQKLEIVGGEDFPTPSLGGWPLAHGDGLVPSASLPMPGVKTRLLQGRGYMQHGNLPNDSNVYREMKSFFGWQTA